MSFSEPADRWFRYFPENYHWSQVFIGVLSLAPMGGSTLWEADQVGQRLKERVGDAKAWEKEWERIADHVENLAKVEERRGHPQTAAGAWIRSAIYRYTGERLIHPDDPRRASSYRKVAEAFERGMRVRVPGFERVEVPYEEGPLPAYWVPPINPLREFPAVVFFDGLDASKETTVIWGGPALRERGIGVLAVDGPGQGEALRLRNIPSRPDYEIPATAAFDCIAGRAGVDPSRIGLMGISFGGYLAPRGRRLRAPLCGLRGLGRALRLSRGVDPKAQFARGGRVGGLLRALAASLRPGSSRHRQRDGEVPRLHPGWGGREDPNAHPHRARRGRRDHSRPDGPPSLRGMRLRRQRAQDLPRGGRGEPTLRPGQPSPGEHLYGRLVDGQIPKPILRRVLAPDARKKAISHSTTWWATTSSQPGILMASRRIIRLEATWRKQDESDPH